MNVAIIGGGVFGTMAAIELAEAGQAVTIFERLPTLMNGTSQNANRLHLGYHYPRHGETVRQCARGYGRFKAEFTQAVLPGVANAYFIASEGSLTSAEGYLAFCDRHGLPYREIDPRRFLPGVAKVDLGVVTEEVMYDPEILHRLIMDRLLRANVRICLGAMVNHIERGGDGGFTLSIANGEKARFDAVVNCTYANVNRLNADLGYEAERRQYEYTAFPVVEFPGKGIASITIMDGPYFGLLPMGGNGDHLLFHVLHSVVAREDGPLLDPAWLDAGTAPFASVDKERWFKMIIDDASEYVPVLRNARLRGVRQGARMVLANAEDTDARPSIVTLREPGYVDVFSGKVVHCMWVGEEVESLLDPHPAQ